ncbi:hypothetical protein [Chryseobacterium hagamense]|uniref:Lipoprotein n=1 Tax=Chryseobacterium hagamense TaxID=395935 RepID=A0A511YKX8_9FLAO|nr:hypothetical protein [Chryseobacterium hagamense]GEN75853.1 hypothetical protein CHA01nite_15930 [Chryseobacterium hagamense]
MEERKFRFLNLMKFLGIVLLLILISCKKENIYYYADKKPIKDSTVIRFIDDELEKLKIDPEEKNLEVYTALDSASYKNNADSIRNKIFNKSLSYNLKPQYRKAFDDWFREKIIVVDNRTGKIINYYSSFKNKKYDRKDVSLSGLRRLIRTGSILYRNPGTEIPGNYLFEHSYPLVSGKELEISRDEALFLSKFGIAVKESSYFCNFISFQDAIGLFRACNDGSAGKPFVIDRIFKNGKKIYTHRNKLRKIFNKESSEKIRYLLSYMKDHSFGAFKKQLKNTENLIFFGAGYDYFTMVNDGKYTYFIYISGVVVTNLKKKEYKVILPGMFKRIEIQYYNAIRK